ncbi:hypothetical protein A2cp1_1317 [Anaeromyxobacter dehalogenans 2CP-1]|uniref:Uncharacterized protein n=1 Tax=Anaeromyxobacter dehalogenans (strain ATCC BAA-258 / DSM 21875 / 2CP-1) TaxID=455488 RepID=B8JGJ0_ANAD2|nr:hypothetical protein [Anaeromyxobacter dehalogenans]ACL64661.1 hypothetical protein A2cp1_1317 [Anaeromyxobacter dehalogenans 2CP-1]
MSEDFLIRFVTENPALSAAVAAVGLHLYRIRRQLLSDRREDTQARREQLHEDLKLFFGNGGGELIRRIVRDENAKQTEGQAEAVRVAIREHEERTDLRIMRSVEDLRLQVNDLEDRIDALDRPRVASQR